jgi:large subunit ribosomal protein L9
MRVLLRKDIENLGGRGEVVDVADGYARNYLLPRELAMKVTKSNMQEVEAALAAKKRRDQEELERVKGVAERLKGFSCTIRERTTEKGHLFGSVNAEDIVDSLVDHGFESIRISNVMLPTPLEDVGEYEVEIMLHPKVSVPIKVKVESLEQEAE